MNRPPVRLAAAAISFFVVASALIGCAVSDEPTEGAIEDESDLDDVDPGMSVDDEPAASVSSELNGCNQCSNCVLFARCRQPRLPFGLTLWNEKVRKINSQTARRGCVAVIKTASIWGHVAFVSSVSGSTIKIEEGNWPRGRCGTRSGTKARLNIAGFICP